MTTKEPAFKTLGIDHKDDRRVLVTAYNGEFCADLVTGITTTNLHLEFSHQDDLSARIFYILKGTAEIRVENAGAPYCLTEINGRTRDRLIVPAGLGYAVRVAPQSRLTCSVEEPARALESVYHPNRVSGVYNVELRILFSKKRTGFTAKQLKFLLPFDQEVVLGGHYHQYREAYSMWRGETTIRLEDVVANREIAETRKEIKLSADLDNYLIMPPGTAHTAKVGARCILVGCTQEAFEGAGSAVPYRNDWLSFKHDDKTKP